jgi:hypothetical protein
MRWLNTCGPQQTVWTSISLYESPTTGLEDGVLQRSVLPLARSRPISGTVSADLADSECEPLQWPAVRSIWRLGGEF